MNSRLSDDRGVSSVELMVLAPVLIAMVLMPIQFALWWHGQQSAALAAEECVDAAQIGGVNVSSEGEAGAMAILGSAGNLTNVMVSARVTNTPGTLGTPTTVSVECLITGDLDFRVVPLGGVEASAVGPVEQFVNEVDR